jgi:hypothetical protein
MLLGLRRVQGHPRFANSHNSVLGPQFFGQDKLKDAFVLVHFALLLVLIQQFGYPVRGLFYQA